MLVAPRPAFIALGLTLAAAALLAILPVFLAPYSVRVGQLFLLAVGLGVAWTILGGFSGYWSFGNAAFVGTGAFAAALTQVAMGQSPAWLAFLVSLAVAALVNALLALAIAWPILRLRGIYFAIAMLGVSQVCFELVSNIDWLHGAIGLNLLDIVPGSVPPERFYYWALLVGAVAITVIAIGIRYSRIGYGLIAIREDEDTARMLGVPTTRYKIVTFVISATLTAMIGVIYAQNLGYITANSVYRNDFNLNVIVYSLLGGMGTIAGPILGAAVMTYVTQVVLGELLDIHMFVTGLLLAVLVLAAPNGIIGIYDATRLNLRRRRLDAGG
ncbi:MAG: branched-chain amino acid ABC transporter permease [Acetobacteraceae bacterium]|nr:branched-chain amino acid ABC transporter permease [Acetobacteraceae bacterium]